MIPILARPDRRRMQNVYAKMSEGAGKCAAYDRRPWQCRTFQRYEDGRCMAVVHMKILTKNALAQYSITEENKRLAPTVLQDQKNIRSWLQTLL